MPRVLLIDDEPGVLFTRLTFDGGFDAEKVELRLDQEQVDSAVEQSEALPVIRVRQLVVGDLAERRELGTRPDRAGDPNAVFVGHCTCDGGGLIRIKGSCGSDLARRRDLVFASMKARVSRAPQSH